MARAIGLIVLPIFLYLFFFWIHLSVLTYSGPGDTFMSPAFQETLLNNELLLNSQGEYILFALRSQLVANLTPRNPLLRHDHHQAQGHAGVPALAS